MVEPEMNFLDRLIDYCQGMRDKVGKSILDDVGAMCRGRKKQLMRGCKNLVEECGQLCGTVLDTDEGYGPKVWCKDCRMGENK